MVELDAETTTQRKEVAETKRVCAEYEFVLNKLRSNKEVLQLVEDIVNK